MRLSFIAVIACVPVVALGCVDGKTPDCSDPAVQCGPDVDGAARDATTDAPVDAPAIVPGTDAAADAPEDADAAEDAPSSDANDAGDAQG